MNLLFEYIYVYVGSAPNSENCSAVRASVHRYIYIKWLQCSVLACWRTHCMQMYMHRILLL